MEEKGEDQVDAAAGAENAGNLDKGYGADEEGGDGNEGFDPETFGVVGFAAYCKGGPDDVPWWEMLGKKKVSSFTFTFTSSF